MSNTFFVLSDRVWQPLPGSEIAEIYPLVRKPDVTCSNAFIIRTPKELVLVDIGGTLEQADEIGRIITSGAPLSLYAVFTHCHIDHCYPAICETELSFSVPPVLMMHEDGAVALETADRSRILADLFGKQIRPVRVPVHLFEEKNHGKGTVRTFFCAGDSSITITRGEHCLSGDKNIATEEIMLPSGLLLKVYHTPGHSPDSICIGIDSTMFTGDLFFATAPGVAGLTGFEQKDLLKSISRVSAILAEGTYTVVCSAHGDPIPLQTAQGALPVLERECEGLASVGVFDRDRMDESRLHAEEILDEACRLFSVIAGRILSVCYHLEAIEETGQADRIRELLDIEKIEMMLDDLLAFHEAFRAGEKHDIQFILKAVQMLGKFGRAFSSSQISSILDLPLVNRAVRFFDEFLQTVQGKPIEARMDVVDVNRLIEDMVREYQAPLCSDEDLIDAAEDESRYREAISRRLSDYDRFIADISELQLEPSAGTVKMDRFFFTDVLLWILEDLALNGYRNIVLETHRDGNQVMISLMGEHPGTCSAFCSERRWWAWDRKVRYSGGDLSPPEWDAETARISISLRSGT